MIWLSAVSLATGGLLAQRFKIIVVAPVDDFDDGHGKRRDTDWLFSWNFDPIWPGCAPGTQVKRSCAAPRAQHGVRRQWPIQKSGRNRSRVD
jgi:hypothetical protein